MIKDGLKLLMVLGVIGGVTTGCAMDINGVGTKFRENPLNGIKEIEVLAQAAKYFNDQTKNNSAGNNDNEENSREYYLCELKKVPEEIRKQFKIIPAGIKALPCFDDTQAKVLNSSQIFSVLALGLMPKLYEALEHSKEKIQFSVQSQNFNQQLKVGFTYEATSNILDKLNTLVEVYHMAVSLQDKRIAQNQTSKDSLLCALEKLREDIANCKKDLTKQAVKLIRELFENDNLEKARQAAGKTIVLKQKNDGTLGMEISTKVPVMQALQKALDKEIESSKQKISSEVLEFYKGSMKNLEEFADMIDFYLSGKVEPSPEIGKKNIKDEVSPLSDDSPERYGLFVGNEEGKNEIFEYMGKNIQSYPNMPYDHDEANFIGMKIDENFCKGFKTLFSKPLRQLSLIDCELADGCTYKDLFKDVKVKYLTIASNDLIKEEAKKAVRSLDSNSLLGVELSGKDFTSVFSPADLDSDTEDE